MVWLNNEGADYDNNEEGKTNMATDSASALFAPAAAVGPEQKALGGKVVVVAVAV